MFEIKSLSRRDFIKIIGSGVLTVAVTGVFLSSMDSKGFSSDKVSAESVPVRNPAFKTAISRKDDLTILYCQNSHGEFLAYALTSNGYEIWEKCLSHDDFMAGHRKNLRQIAKDLSLSKYFATKDKLEAVREFIISLQSKGLVFQADSDDVRIYIPRHG